MVNRLQYTLKCRVICIRSRGAYMYHITNNMCKFPMMLHGGPQPGAAFLKLSEGLDWGIPTILLSGRYITRLTGIHALPCLNVNLPSGLKPTLLMNNTRMFACSNCWYLCTSYRSPPGLRHRPSPLVEPRPQSSLKRPRCNPLARQSSSDLPGSWRPGRSGFRVAGQHTGGLQRLWSLGGSVLDLQQRS